MLQTGAMEAMIYDVDMRNGNPCEGREKADKAKGGVDMQHQIYVNKIFLKSGTNLLRCFHATVSLQLDESLPQHPNALQWTLGTNDPPVTLLRA